jgi:hypothetical protein
MKDHPIELAYRAHAYVPSGDYRRGRRKKMYNPIRTTPALVEAMIHLGPSEMNLQEARHRAKRAVGHPQATQRIDALDWTDLLDFLNTIALFLKAGPQGRKERGMRQFEDRESNVLSSKEVTQLARPLASEQIKGSVVKNKLKTMGAHVTAARDKWEALAALARFYPRNGIPKGYVDALVEQLESTDLDSFKQIVAQSLIFYEADRIKERNRR